MFCRKTKLSFWCDFCLFCGKWVSEWWLKVLMAIIQTWRPWQNTSNQRNFNEFFGSASLWPVSPSDCQQPLTGNTHFPTLIKYVSLCYWGLREFMSEFYKKKLKLNQDYVKFYILDLNPTEVNCQWNCRPFSLSSDLSNTFFSFSNTSNQLYSPSPEFTDMCSWMLEFWFVFTVYISLQKTILCLLKRSWIINVNMPLRKPLWTLSSSAHLYQTCFWISFHFSGERHRGVFQTYMSKWRTPDVLWPLRSQSWCYYCKWRFFYDFWTLILI